MDECKLYELSGQVEMDQVMVRAMAAMTQQRYDCLASSRDQLFALLYSFWGCMLWSWAFYISHKMVWALDK